MKRVVFLFASLLIFNAGHAQKGVWQPVADNDVKSLEKTDRIAMPSAYQLFKVNLSGLKQILLDAPDRKSNFGPSTVIVQFPDGDGTLQHYRIYEASVMHPALAAEHPDMKSYAGQGIENPAATVRFSFTIFGLHAMILSPQGVVYTDPYTTDLENYIVYKKADLKEDRPFFCARGGSNDTGRLAQRDALTTFSSDGVLRTYRLAMACTMQYAAYHVKQAGRTNGTTAQKKAAVLAAMVVTLTRINGVYEKELAVTMELVPNNTNIIFLTDNGFANDDAERLIDQSQTTIDGYIGDANYDIGHTVSTDAGGLAGLGVACNSGEKANGVTGNAAPVGDPYDIDFVAHEMGHQYGAEHTFNGVSGSCGGGNANPDVTRNGTLIQGTNVEPGSGTTIMAYAGICGTADVQLHSDAYFHTVSLDQIFSYIRSTSCPVTTPTGNTAPVVSTIATFTIPKRTAFVLRGSIATDVQGDALTYCWEQTNTTKTTIDTPRASNADGPNFRSLSPTTSKDRYMPQLSDVLESNLYPTWEVTSTVGRTFNFAYTVRDNNVKGGQTTRRNTTVVVSSVAGPFAVTSQADGTPLTEGTQQTVTWDVAGTKTNNINAANVNILLSTDGGQTFATVLASATANDGSEVITLPKIIADNCRIIVEAAGNIFYAVNDTAFAITDDMAAGNEFGLKNFSIYPNPNNGAFTVQFVPASQQSISISAHDMRGREVFAKTYPNAGLFSGIVSLNGVQSGVYLVTVHNGGYKEVRKVVVN